MDLEEKEGIEGRRKMILLQRHKKNNTKNISKILEEIAITLKKIIIDKEEGEKVKSRMVKNRPNPANWM